MTTVAIVGAGPYGLSIAAHLRAQGIAYRIFGVPMQMWATQCPRGMFLKSDAFAADLYDPARQFTLKKFCQENQLDYHDSEIPVAVETFVAYGQAFQKACVPDLTERAVSRVSPAQDGFRLEIEGGEIVLARAVVMATGVCYSSVIPEELRALPADRYSHSSAHCDLTALAGKRVLVLGGGASATDIAAILHGLGTPVEILSRRPINFHTKTDHTHRSLWDRVTKPNLGLGPNLRSTLYVAFPNLFHLLPQRLRLAITRRALPPAAHYSTRHHVEGKVPLHIGYRIRKARLLAGEVRVDCVNDGGHAVELTADHIIASTGYRPSVDRLEMLDSKLRSQITREDGSPLLSRNLESSVRGLYFVGLQSANSFGPVMRFVRGSEWVAKHLTRHLAAAYRTADVRPSVSPTTT
jgi:cation diffusion facilitator CzcD-associated flavoprotein CzcO